MIKERYISAVTDTTVNIVNSQLESIRNKSITKTSQRVYHDGFIGAAGAIGAFSEDELLNAAMDALNNHIDYQINPSCGQVIAYDMRKPFLKAQDVKSEVNSLLCELRERQPDFIFSNKISLTEVEAGIVNDNGLKLDYADRTLSAGLIFKEKTSASVFDGSIGFRERKYDRKLIVGEFDMILNAYGKKLSLSKGGRYPVIFMTEEAPVDKFLSDLKADVFMKGGSLFSGKIGRQLFNESFTFTQDLNPETAYLTPFFDAEGVVNPGFVFNMIENGILKAPYCDKKTAHKYGINPSGSAFAPYDGVPQASLLHPAIKKTAGSLKDLLCGQTGIVVLTAAGGDFTPKGDYATPVQLALLTDGEHLLGRLPEFNLTSNIYEMFGKGYRGTCDSWLPFSTGTFTVLDMDLTVN
jgi:PmbA protein